MERKVNVIKDLDGRKTVVIQDIRFKGKRAIDWDDVEKYLIDFIGEIYNIAEADEEIYIRRIVDDEMNKRKEAFEM